MHVVFAAPECSPWVKTGGLGEVLGALPAAIAHLGHRVTVYVPYYRQVQQILRLLPDATDPPVVLRSVTVPFSDRNHFVRILDGGEHDHVQIYFVDCPAFFDREGVYGPPGRNYPDNHLRYGLYCRAMLESCKLLGAPDIFHAHDWQCAFIPLLLATTYAEDPLLSDAATVFTIHNGVYQGRFQPAGLRELLLPLTLMDESVLASGDEANPFKAGILYSNAITTVSPGYAKELQTVEFGEGLDPIYRERAGVFTGILNGIDGHLWNPASDSHLAAHYSADDLSGKVECRRDLLHAFGADGVSINTAMIGIVSRIAVQKGFDLLAEAMPQIAEQEVLLLILGSGEPELEDLFRDLAGRYPRHLRVNFEFQDSLAHKVYAGSDMTLMPSRYEPSGLTQMYSLRYGSVPVVRATGGLADTVVPGEQGNGFVFYEYETEALVDAIKHAVASFREPESWKSRMQRGMRSDMGWAAPAKAYQAVYQDAVDLHLRRSASFAAIRNTGTREFRAQ